VSFLPVVHSSSRQLQIFDSLPFPALHLIAFSPQEPQQQQQQQQQQPQQADEPTALTPLCQASSFSAKSIATPPSQLDPPHPAASPLNI
jgi:hypothetical protein